MNELRLVLLRHAKAESHSATDAERTLTDRGRADAAAVGRWLADSGVLPDHVVVSPARRAQQTWQRAAEQLPTDVEPVTDDRIYANGLDELLAIIREAPPDVTILCLVGHNPSMATLAMTLDDGSGDVSARREMAAGYPTSGVAIFSIPVPWRDVQAASGTLLAFAAPRGE